MSNLQNNLRKTKNLHHAIRNHLSDDKTSIVTQNVLQMFRF